MARFGTPLDVTVAELATMLRNDSSPLVAVAQPQRDDHVARPLDLDVRLGLVAGIGAQLLVQFGQPRGRR